MYFTDEKDYIMRMIKEMVRVLFSLMFGKKYVSVELEKENKYEVSGKNLKDFLDMIDSGEINEAENILLDSIDYTDRNGSMIIQVVGVFEYFLAKVISKENSSFYVKWLNTIIIAFIPISMITSYISELIFKVGGGISPYPIGIFHSFVFLLVYLIVIMVSYAYLKKQNKFLI